MTNFEGQPILSDDELRAEFAALFPNGLAGADVLAELAPDGWAESPLVAVFHPSAAQLFGESLRVHRNLATLPRRPDAPPMPSEPTLAEFEAGHEDSEVDPERECRELVGLCLWDLLGDNHEAFAADGRKIDLGSMRSAGGFLAEVLNAQGARPLPRPDLDGMLDEFLAKAGGGPEQTAFMAEMRKEMIGDGGYTYLDFYMGTHMIAGRADLRPVYEMIFRRMRGRGTDWAYTFPRLYAVDLRPLTKVLDDKERGDEPEFAGYDPSAALEQEQADREHDESLAEMREQLDEGHREAVAAAQEADPPATVLAYQAVYGQLPRGWPPEA
jgi:hypothetical protein